jgi:hypothetical protein
MSFNQKSIGQALMEYTLPLGLIALLSGVVIWGLNVAEPLAHLLSGTLKGNQAGTLLVIQPFGLVPNPPMSQPAPPFQTKTLNMTLANGAVINISGYPANMAESFETAGGAGTTTYLSAKLEELAQKLLDAGQINDEQYNSLIQLANSGYGVAELQDAIKNNMPSTISGDPMYSSDFAYNATIVIPWKPQGLVVCSGCTLDDGTPFYLGEAVQNLRWMTVDGGPTTISPDTDPMFKGFMIHDLIGKYKAVRDDNLLTDPVIASVVQDLVSTIAWSSDATQYADSPSELGERYNTTVNSSGGICGLGGGNAPTGVSCS